MSKHNPIHLEVLIQPIFEDTDGNKYPYKGIPNDEGVPEEAGDGEDQFNFIIYILHYYIDITNIDFINFDQELTKGRLEIERLTHFQKNMLESIYEFTGEHPIKYGPTYLTFKILCGDSYCNCNFCSEEDEDGSYYDYDYDSI
jgi:hypothetical protein